MSASFQTLCVLRSVHGWTGGAYRDLGYVIPAECEQALRGRRILTRVREGALHVVVETSQGAPAVSVEGAALRVGLALEDANFSNYTAPASTAPPGQILRWSNAADALRLAPEEPCALTGSVLSHAIASPARPLTVSLTREGRALRSETVRAAAQTTASFDLRGCAPGVYEALEASDAGAVTRRPYVLHPELTARPIAGLVEVTLRDAFVAAPPVFEVRFEAREERVAYYVVAASFTEDELSQLSVVDLGGAPAVVFDRVAEADLALTASTLAGPGARLVAFRAKTAMARAATPRRRIELRRAVPTGGNGPVTTTLIANLPQPAPTRADSNIVIHITK